VAALATEAAPESIHTFTVGFDVPEYDESRFAQSVATAIGSHHTRCVLTEGDFHEQLPDALDCVDQPTFDAINTYFVSRAAREAGMTVALAGTGGDELFGGYPTYSEIPRACRAFGWLPADRNGLPRKILDRAVRFGAGLAGRFWWDILRTTPPQTRWGKVADLACALPDTLRLYQVSYALFTRDTLGRLAADRIRWELKGQVDGLSAQAAAAWRRRIEKSDPLHAVSLLELSGFVGERLLRDTDTASMAVSLEARVPLLDHRLIETIAGIDTNRRFRPLGRKQLLRDLALARLDPSLFERPKSGFVLPIGVWARRRLQGRMEEVFADTSLAGRAGLRPEAVAILWKSFLAGRPGLYWSRVWAVYVLLEWCRRHDVSLDG
jgi:asparagine synthase (glutamine-hydrolysing)